MNPKSTPTPAEALRALWTYCTAGDWTGWDPYDALAATSPVARQLARSRPGRLLLTQLLKRSPWNLRPLLGVPKTRNAKALALGLLAACRLRHRPEFRESAIREALKLVADLHAIAIETRHGVGWGFPFEYEVRAFNFPKGTPTVVITGLVVRALHLAMQEFELGAETNAKCRALIHSAARFVLNDLQRTRDADGICFSYSPIDNSRVVNATLFAAEILVRSGCIAGEKVGEAEIVDTARWAWSRQDPAGGWVYGEAGHHAWQDSLHTAFNLLSLHFIRDGLAQLGMDATQVVPVGRWQRGYENFVRTFIEPSGRVRYYAHSPWPEDGHSVASALLLLSVGRAVDPEAEARIAQVYGYCVRRLWSRDGYFKDQRGRWLSISVPYMRWTEAWMLHALSEVVLGRGARPALSP